MKRKMPNPTKKSRTLVANATVKVDCRNNRRSLDVPAFGNVRAFEHALLERLFFG
jgi:hypothetical protein